MDTLTNACIAMIYYLIFVVCYMFLLKVRGIWEKIRKIGTRKIICNYQFVFWALIPVVLSWHLSKDVSWLRIPDLKALALIPTFFSLNFLNTFLEDWYRIRVKRDQKLIKSLEERKFSVQERLHESGEQLYYIGLPEEFISRGFLITFLMPITGNIVAAIISSISFGVMHLSQHDLLTGFRTALNGLLYALSFLFSTSIWIPVAVHILLNLLFPILFKVMIRTCTNRNLIIDSS